MHLAPQVHVCPSSREGFGHYINEARSVGALVVTIAAGPMNELVQDGKSGVVAPVARLPPRPLASHDCFWKPRVT